jgi:peptide/nickel transport system substrate-binding protein
MRKLRSVPVLMLLGALLLIGLAPVAFAQNTGVYVYSDQVLLHFDPAEIFSVNIVWFNVYERLLRYNPDTDMFEPELAVSYEKSEDGLEWIFRIREGVKFHTGNMLDAAAVKGCIERTKAMGEGVSYIWDPVENIEVLDTYTVKFTLSVPVAFDLVVSSLAGALIYDPAYGDKAWYEAGNDSGTGPYSFVSNTDLEEASIKRFDDYWRGWEAGQFDGVIFKQVPDDSTRRLMLETGGADFTNRLANEMLDAIEANPDLEIVTKTGWVYFNTLKPPLDSLLVRKALAFTIPYDEIIDGALLGLAEQSHGFVMKTLWGHSDEVRAYSYNPSVARELLAEAGYPGGGFKLVFTYNLGDEKERRTGELWKAKLAEFNIDLDIRAMPWDAQIGMAHDPDPLKRQDVFHMYAWPLSPTPLSLLVDNYGTADPPLLNVSYYSNPAIDALLRRANNIAGIDRVGAAAIVVETQHIVIDDVPIIPVADLKEAVIKQASVVGEVLSFVNPAYPRCVDWYRLRKK